MGSQPMPPVVRSRQQLKALGVSFLAPGTLEPSDLPICSDGITYSMAQEATWLDQRHFAVGRWDGSLSVFRFSDSSTAGPIITKAVNSPSAEGVQMITWLAAGRFATSNDEQSILFWEAPDDSWSNLKIMFLGRYDAALGPATCGDSVVLADRVFLLVGHANGYLSVWRCGLDLADIELAKVLDLRNAAPTNPFGMQHVRGVSLVDLEGDQARFVTGSENGDLCVIEIPSGKILSRISYNPDAQRGINTVAASGPRVLVGNCSVGPLDRNLWCFALDRATWKLELTDSVNLKVKQAEPQAFNFSAVWGFCRSGRCFFSSTEEGALWMGTVGADGKISLLGYKEVTSSLGAALAFSNRGRLVMVAYDLYEFTTGPEKAARETANPEWIYGQL